MSINIKTNKLTDNDIRYNISEIGEQLMNTRTKTEELTADDITNAAGKQITVIAGIATARAEIQQTIQDIKDPELPTLEQDSYPLRHTQEKLTNITYMLDELIQFLTDETAENIAAEIDSRRLIQ